MKGHFTSSSALGARSVGQNLSAIAHEKRNESGKILRTLSSHAMAKQSICTGSTCLTICTVLVWIASSVRIVAMPMPLIETF
eukprot:1963633-Pleurochrysis_carterae.AAC.3